MKHKKFKSVKFDNKKRVFKLVYSSGLKLECPFSALGIDVKVEDAGVDSEVGGHSFYFLLENGQKDFVPYDQPLAINQNPEFIKRQTLYKITKSIIQFIEEEGVSKREVARRLNTSMSQLLRILDPTNYKKELSRLIEIASLLNYEFKWNFKKVL